MYSVQHVQRTMLSNRAITKSPFQSPQSCIFHAPRQFLFTYDSYMHNAFPKDELKPLSCTGAVRG